MAGFFGVANGEDMFCVVLRTRWSIATHLSLVTGQDEPDLIHDVILIGFYPKRHNYNHHNKLNK